MALSQSLLDILACPTDKGPLLYAEGEAALYNPRLRLRYAIRDGIPVLLASAASAVDDDEHLRLMRAARG